jgi:hypothetical protein
MNRDPDIKAILRLARFLETGQVETRRAASAGKLLLDAGERGTIAASASDLKHMASLGILARDGARLALTDAGRSFLRRQTPDGLLDQHRDLEQRQIELPGGRQTATVNLAESPLGQLFRRKDRNGKPFLSEREFRAGERLRADYTRGQIMPRLGANWIASVASGRRDGAGGMADLTDAALAARQRVEQAIDAVGPELDGVLIDICCFLKGFEQVEAERGWPVRSAKIVLKTALGSLSRHYEPESVARTRRRVLHWGSEDFRPRMDG